MAGEPASSARDPKTQEDPPRGRVLIVDDTPANLALLSEMLMERGYDVIVATNGPRALALVEASPPDLVMLDVNMPEMDGYEVCRRLHAGERTARLPVIFLSALDETKDKLAAFAAGGRDYVTKPFQVEEVMARVETQITIARLTEELAKKNLELHARNDELVAAQRRTKRVFDALSELLPGKVLDGKYLLEEKIGAGGFGTVFRAKHLTLARPLAVKVFRPSPGNDTEVGLARFRAEGARACRLDHPNVVAVLDSGTSDGGIAYLVMELLQGRSLAEELAERGPLAVARTIEIVVPICRALAEAAARRMVHRDIKPANVFLHRGRDGEVVKVVDFGIAKLLEEAPEGEDHGDVTMTGAIVGSPAYMSPERILGKEYDERADVYSVGIMLYQMLCGKMPFEKASGNHAMAIRALVDTPPSLDDLVPGIPAGLSSVVAKAMTREAAARPTALELASALLAFASSETRATLADGELATPSAPTRT
jgi:DNA-binding response OmpR family regulator